MCVPAFFDLELSSCTSSSSLFLYSSKLMPRVPPTAIITHDEPLSEMAALVGVALAEEAVTVTVCS